MSEDSEETPAAAPATKAARKKPAARKAAKPKAKAAAAETESPAPAESVPAPEPPKESVPAEAVDRAAAEAESRGDGEGPEPIPFFTESPAGDPPGNTKKRRRRKKKKSGDAQQGLHPHAVAPARDTHHEPDDSAPAPAMHGAPRAKLDQEEVAKKAWKMFQAEVGEEGLALIDDHDAREISRRCFRLAEIFLDEASRRNR